jgi:hypothetical protein
MSIRHWRRQAVRYPAEPGIWQGLAAAIPKNLYKILNIHGIHTYTSMHAAHLLGQVAGLVGFMLMGCS